MQSVHWKNLRFDWNPFENDPSSYRWPYLALSLGPIYAIQLSGAVLWRGKNTELPVVGESWELFSEADYDVDIDPRLGFSVETHLLKVLGGVTLVAECAGEVISL